MAYRQALFCVITPAKNMGLESHSGHAVKQGSIRVLVIDDDDDVREILQAALESEGYAVAGAADGHEGLLRQRENPAAVVVTDIFMPGKEGIETIVEIVGEFPQTKVIAVSGASS